jgi:hypothetical protein
MASSKKQLRKRCPICKKLRGFREPSGDTHGEDHPNRKPWEKIAGRWVCGWCAGTETGAIGCGTVPHQDECLAAPQTETDTEPYQISTNTVFFFWRKGEDVSDMAAELFRSDPGETWFEGRQKAATRLRCGVEDLTWKRKG